MPVKHIILLWLLSSFALPLLSQSVEIAEIPGWKHEMIGDVHQFQPVNLFSKKEIFVYEIFPLQALEYETREEALKAFAEQDLAASAYQLREKPDEVKRSNEVYIYGLFANDQDNKHWSLVYMMYATADKQLRFAKIRGVEQYAFQNYLKQAGAHYVNLALSEGVQPQASAKQQETRQSSKPQRRSDNEERVEVQTSPGKGLTADKVKGGLMLRHYGLYGEFFSHYLMLKDGSIYKDTNIPPCDLDVAKSRQMEAEQWGKWKMEGDKLLIQWNDEQEQHEYKPNSGYYFLRAAAKDTKLEGEFITTSSGGNTTLGGNVLTFAAKTLLSTRKVISRWSVLPGVAAVMLRHMHSGMRRERIPLRVI